MTTSIMILDQVLGIIQSHIQKEENLKVAESLAVNPTGVDGVPYRALTLLINDLPVAILGLTTPEFTAQTPIFSQSIARRALARKSPYILLSNLQEVFLAPTPRKAEESIEVIKHYPLLFLASHSSLGELPKTDEIQVENLLTRIFSDLITLKKDGHLFLEIPDSDYFVARLVKAVEILKPAVKKALISEINVKPDFAKELANWAMPQGIPVDLKSEVFSEAVVRQAIYRLLGKIIFYQSLRRARPELPELDLSNLDSSQVIVRLYACFSKAHEIDYHAVFREDIIDRLPFPAAASIELRALVEDLNTRDFAHLPQDVVGTVFERLIPPEDRHALGQFFTPEPLVDLITGFCVRNPDDKVLDPTCGTGTFLIRAYNRLQNQLGVHDHSRLLGQLWGVDIAPFPAELATINLFRQQVEDTENFPRVLNEDFFQVTPGGHYRFPPLKADLPTQVQVDEPIPQFDAIVGNFPYISADRIEQAQKGYLKKTIYPRLSQEWFQQYPEGFCFQKKGTKNEFENARKNDLPLVEYQSKAEPDVSIYSDFYAYLFWHAAAFLKPGGRMGIVTSNAWLDVGFGYGLQKFFLNNFKIVAILESRCEPWFEQAAVNTIVTIVERCDNDEERDTNPARFVKIKQPLNQLIPWDMHNDALNRWLGIQKVVHQIETVWQTSDDPQQPFTWENETLRVRSVRQRTLRQLGAKTGKTVKWGPYLRAPEVYFDLISNLNHKITKLGNIAPPTFGSKSGINEFFHLTPQKLQHHQIDSEFLLPLLKSPGDSDRILINIGELPLKVFVCRKSKDELKTSRQINTLEYVEWGEKQKFTTGPQIGLTWPNGAEVRNRKPGWYALPEYRSYFGNIFLPQAFGEKFVIKFSEEPVIADARLYFLSPIDEVDPHILAAVMNSFVSALFIEVTGRVSMGDGALELKVDDAFEYLFIPDITQFTSDHKVKITEAFKQLLQRPIHSVFTEIKLEDRRLFDATVVDVLGINHEIWLPRIYEGLTALVKERLDLAKKRGQSRKLHTKKAASKVLDEVLQEVLPDGPQHFPEDFFSAAAKSGNFIELKLPSVPVRDVGPMFGKEELATQDGITIQVNNKFEAQFVLFSQAAGQTLVRIPERTVECSRTVNDYKKYLRDLRQQMHETYFRRTLDQAQAERLSAEAWRKLALPIIED